MGLTPEQMGLKPEEIEVTASPEEKEKAELAEVTGDFEKLSQETIERSKDPQLEQKVGRLSKDKGMKYRNTLHVLSSAMLGLGAGLMLRGQGASPEISVGIGAVTAGMAFKLETALRVLTGDLRER